MARVYDIMHGPVIPASTEESVRRAVARMDDLHLDCLPVLDRGGQLVGLLTSWDVRRSHPNRLVVDAMTTRLVAVAGSTSVWEAFELAVQNSVEHLPVVEGERLVGMVTRTELEVIAARLTDALTGLPTAAYLRYEVERRWRTGHNVCLIFIDINEFGALNKRLGHVAGDQALQLIMRILSSQLNPEKETLCRYGGDEFAIVTTRPDTEAKLLAGTLVGEVAHATRSTGVALTVSVGIASGRHRSLRHQDTATVDGLINLASRASTQAKQNNAGVLLIEVAAGD